MLSTTSNPQQLARVERVIVRALHPTPEVFPLAVDDAAVQYVALSGIYRIFTPLDTERDGYVGRSKNMGRRLYTHLLALINGQHDSPDFQEAWNRYGEKSFVAEILVQCDGPALSMAMEQKYLAQYPRAYNAMMAGATRDPSVRPKKKLQSRPMIRPLRLPSDAMDYLNKLSDFDGISPDKFCATMIYAAAKVAGIFGKGER